MPYIDFTWYGFTGNPSLSKIPEVTSPQSLHNESHCYILLMLQKSGDHQLGLVVYPIIYKVLYLLGVDRRNFWTINSISLSTYLLSCQPHEGHLPMFFSAETTPLVHVSLPPVAHGPGMLGLWTSKRAGWCSTPTLVLICWSFSMDNGHPLLVCSSLSTAQRDFSKTTLHRRKRLSEKKRHSPVRNRNWNDLWHNKWYVFMMYAEVLLGNNRKIEADQQITEVHKS